MAKDRPPLQNSNASVEGLRDGNGMMKLKATAWINPSEDERFNQEHIDACKDIAQKIDDLNLSIRIELVHKKGQDFQSWPTLGYFNLFRPWREEQQPQQSEPPRRDRAFGE